MPLTIKKLILDEIDELDEFPFYAIIPKFMELHRGILLKGDIIFESDDNYKINEDDFLQLQKQIKDIITSENLNICKYVEYGYRTRNKYRSDYLKPLGAKDQAELLNRKSNWIYEKGKPAYFLCRKEVMNQ